MIPERIGRVQGNWGGGEEGKMGKKFLHKSKFKSWFDGGRITFGKVGINAYSTKEKYE